MRQLEVTEVFHHTFDPSTGIVHAQLKITNVSSDDVHNVKLIIEDTQHLLQEQLIKRTRGSLTFEPTETCLELGNLAPDESAFFEYKYHPLDAPTVFTNQISLTYAPTNNLQTLLPEKKVAEFFSDPATK